MADFSGGPGFLAFMATLILVVGVVVLLRSLNNHLRKVRVNPPAEDAPADQEAPSAPTPATDA